MRSYSSLLCHILGSNKSISGYAEMQQSYKNLFSFIKLNLKVYYSTDFELSKRFVLDKILHNKYKIFSKGLKRKNIYFVFLIRKPKDTINSIVRLGNSFNQQQWFSDPEVATNYYINRLMQLEEIAKEINKHNAIFIESEKIVNNTIGILDSLSQWLKLEINLSTTFSTFKYTGLPGYGDTSNLIMNGKVIVKNKNESKFHLLPNELFSKAEESYSSCKKVLQTECNIIKINEIED